MKTLAIIGSTGSIGLSSLNVYSQNKGKIKLDYIAANKNFDLLKKQINKFKPKYFYLFDTEYKILKSDNKFKSIDFFINNKVKFDYLISGISSYDSIDINFKLTKITKNLLIANKETIICGGKIFLNYAKKNKCNILPIDSEHHCISEYLRKKKSNEDIKKVYLIASGGPFLKKKIKKKEKIKNVINHPNWKMGKKISVDSSTFANKVMEIFEAKILFNLENKDIKILVESKSLVHSIVTLKNNISYFICHYPNMEIPISNSLGFLNKFPLSFDDLKINVKKPDLKKFPLIKLGYSILKYGFAGMIIFTVLNERLVELYLKNKITYGDIVSKLIILFKKKQIVNVSKKCIKNKSDINKIIKKANLIKL